MTDEELERWRANLECMREQINQAANNMTEDDRELPIRMIACAKNDEGRHVTAYCRSPETARKYTDSKTVGRA